MSTRICGSEAPDAVGVWQACVRPAGHDGMHMAIRRGHTWSERFSWSDWYANLKVRLRADEARQPAGLHMTAERSPPPPLPRL